MDCEDIEIAAGWTGEADSLVMNLVDLKFIDVCEGVYVVHDWAENNPWAADATKRSNQARNAARAKWDKSENKPLNTNSMEKDAVSIKKDADVMPTALLISAAASNEQCPLPILSLPYLTLPYQTKKTDNLNNLFPDALRLSAMFGDMILLDMPDFRELQQQKRDATIIRWAGDIGATIRIDNRDVEEVEALLIWCRSDPFWKVNVLSGSKFRVKYDQLSAKMKGDKNVKANSSAKWGRFREANATP